jgi:hypothetical protein
MTTAQLIESEQGTEFIAAIDDFMENLTEYAARSSNSVEDLYQMTDKVRARLFELGGDVPESMAAPVLPS